MEEPQQVVAERVVRDLLGLGAPSTSNANITFQGATNWQLTSAMTCAAIGAAFGFFGLYTASKTESQTQSALSVMQRKLDRIEDYQTTSYMLLPELRKQIEESLNKRKPQEK